MGLDPPAGAPLLGRGRTCDVWDLGDGTVLRRYRDGRDAGPETRAMRDLRAAGAPVPEVITAEGPDVVMQRIAGPTLLERSLARPWRVRGTAVLLRHLLAEVAAVAPVAELPTPFGDGGATLHLDLHPGNVVLSADGPVIIDWDNVARGPAGADVAQSWMLLATSDVPVALIARPAVTALARALARAVLPPHDPAVAHRAAVLRRRLTQHDLSAVERRRLHRLLTRAQAAELA